ncbi:helix-turn-helix domain-containing protein [Gluconacetobacter sacchari]|uniref:helix-turn-helix domain-containing protein n=1 Tax=Gluconacetobacter sacchari TaxID=92759 RepID=UPI0039B51602
MHSHSHGEIYVIQNGHLLSTSADARWLIPAGQAYWVPAGTLHGGSLSNVSGIRIHVSADMTKELFPEAAVVFNATPLILALMERWGEEAEHGLPKRMLDSHRLAVLLDEMARSIAQPVILPIPTHQVMRQVMSDWSMECDERASLDELASRCRMSRRTFTRHFREETGLSPGVWMQTARLLRGYSLMASGASVTETAFMLGYDSATSFFNLCRRFTGMNPSDFARK